MVFEFLEPGMWMDRTANHRAKVWVNVMLVFLEFRYQGSVFSSN